MLTHHDLPQSAASSEFPHSHTGYSAYSVDDHTALAASTAPPADHWSRAGMPPCPPSATPSAYSHNPQQQQQSYQTQPSAHPHWSSNDSTASSSSSSSSSCSSTPPLSSAAPPVPSSASQFPPPIHLPGSASSAAGGGNGSKPRAPRFVDTFQSRILKQPLESELSPSSLCRPKRKRRAPVLDASTKVIRSQKHNEAEVRRRQRLNNLLLELAEVVGCRKPQKGAILRLTLEKVRTMERKIAAMEEKMRSMEKEKEQHDRGDSRDRVKPSPSSAEQGGSERERGGGTELVKVTVDAGALSGPAYTAGYDCSILSSSSGLAASPTWSGAGWTGCFGSSSSSSSSMISPSPLPLSLFPMGSMASPQPLLTMAGYDQPSGQGGFPSPTPLPSIPSSASSMTGSSLSSLSSPLSHCAPSPMVKREHLHPSSSISSLSSRFELIHSATVAMNVVDLNGRALDCNRHFAAFLGCSRPALLSPSATFFDWTHPDSLSVSVEMLSQLIANSRSTVRGVKRYITKSGRVRAAAVTIWMCEDAAGRANQVAVIVEPMDDDVNGCLL